MIFLILHGNLVRNYCNFKKNIVQFTHRRGKQDPFELTIFLSLIILHSMFGKTKIIVAMFYIIYNLDV